MMGGSLTAVSELGLGTSITFEITLPTAEDPPKRRHPCPATP